MQGVSGITAVEARNPGAKSIAKNSGATFDDKNDGELWFASACKHLLQDKPVGAELHYVTGFDPRACQRYAAGHSAPPAYFLRALLRSPQGWTWLCAAMADCQEPWWKEVQYAYEIIAVFEAKRKELLSGSGGGAAKAAGST